MQLMGGNLTLRQNMTTATAQATPVKMNICADRWTLKSFSLKSRMFTTKENIAGNKRTLEYTIWESQHIRCAVINVFQDNKKIRSINLD